MPEFSGRTDVIVSSNRFGEMVNLRSNFPNNLLIQSRTQPDSNSNQIVLAVGKQNGFGTRNYGPRSYACKLPRVECSEITTLHAQSSDKDFDLPTTWLQFF
jgi:hypothetical protein